MNLYTQIAEAMTDKEILRIKNYVIGVFDGRSFSCSHITDYNAANAPKMKYHYSWDWLMRAWYKFVDLRFKDVMDQLKHSELKTTCGFAILYGDIKVAHNNIYEAIIWYNTLETVNGKLV